MEELLKLKKDLVKIVDVLICLCVFIFALYTCHVEFVSDYKILKMYIIYVVSLIISYQLVGIYKTIWKYMHINVLFLLFSVTVTSLTVGSLMIRIILDVPISLEFCSIIILGTTLLIMFSRIFYYYISEYSNKLNNHCPKKNLLIIGGGEACLFVLKELKQNNKENYVPIGILDDDISKQGRYVWDVEVLGDTSKIEEYVDKYKIDTILFTIVNISASRKKELLGKCTIACKDVVVLECVFDNLFLKERIELKKITMEDLLGRDSVLFQEKEAREYLINKVVVVTGGGGSIGSELCLQIGYCNPKAIIILDINENSSYEIQLKLKEKLPSGVGIFVEIASVRDKKKLNSLFNKYKPDIVFHAAAHKHVPLMETNPEEAAKNNVGGTMNVLEMCDRYNVERFILISTDKAVNPSSVMGATKRICEKLMIAYSMNSKTIFTAVRFGNVLGSNGSVVPIFKRQIENGGPITVTHPDIERYFMTIPEAVSLVIEAGAMAKGGEIFVLNMGEPIKIKDLAENMIRLSGLVPYEDIEIHYIGLRPGEKLYEELLIDTSNLKTTQNNKIFEEYFRDENKAKLLAECKKLVAKADNEMGSDIKLLIKEIVPEYKYKKI